MKTFPPVNLYLCSHSSVHPKHLRVLPVKIDAQSKAIERRRKKQRPLKSKDSRKVIGIDYAYGGSIAGPASVEKNLIRHLSIITKINKIHDYRDFS